MDNNKTKETWEWTIIRFKKHPLFHYGALWKDFIKVHIFYLLGNNFTCLDKQSEAEKYRQKRTKRSNSPLSHTLDNKIFF